MARRSKRGTTSLSTRTGWRLIYLALFTLGWSRAPTEADFLCAGQVPGGAAPAPAAVAKPAQTRTIGTRQALVLFARFRGGGQTRVPTWAADLFSPNKPGSFSHYYDTMSFGTLKVRGQVAPRVYESAREVGYYLAADDTASGRYDQFAREILQQADQDLDFAQFDTDGPDGIPNSGDDDGVVDAVFLVLDTNPAAYSEDGRLSVRLEDIRMAAGVALARVRTRPLILELTDVVVIDESGDKIAVAGELLRLSFKLANRGGLAARNTTARIFSDDPLVEIVQPETGFGDLGVDRTNPTSPKGGFPALRFLPGFAGRHTAVVRIEVYADSVLVEDQQVEVSALSPRAVVRKVTVLDDQGNGDGMVQGGEFIRLGIDLEVPQPDWLEVFRLSLRPLTAGVFQVGEDGVTLQFAGEGRARSQSSPEFLVPAGLPPGTSLDFELATAGAFGAWADTLSVQVQPGPDQTPPRVTEVLSRRAGQGLRVAAPDRRILEGDQVESVRAVVYSPEDTVELATFPLVRQVDRYEGVWAPPEPGPYLLAVVAQDRAGNQGSSTLQTVRVPSASARTSSWEALTLPAAGMRLVVSQLIPAPGSPEVVYAVAAQGLWRGLDRGATWQRAGWMRSADIQGIPTGAHLVPGVLVDPMDPLTLYVNQQAGKR